MAYQGDPPPSESALMLVILRAGLRGGATLPACRSRLLRLSVCDEDSTEGDRVPDDDRLTRRLALAFDHLGRAGLVRLRRNGEFTTTARGRQVLRENPDGVDDGVLMQFAEFRSFIGDRSGWKALPPAEEVAAFDRGIDDFDRGRRPTENPYAPDTAEHFAWHHGWREARDDAMREQETLFRVAL